MNRRKFIVFTTSAAVGTAIGVGSLSASTATPSPLRATDPKKALVLWYSQTGHTERIGRLLAKTLESEGLSVTVGSMASTDPATASDYDLIFFGTPVQYMDVPHNVKNWMKRLPDLAGIATASWVTYGGHGDNMHNTACGLLEAAAAKKAAPIGLGKFGNMSTFAPTWSAMGNKERILRYRQFPDEQTYESARAYAALIVSRIRTDQSFEFEREFTFSGLAASMDMVWLTKKMINVHTIDEKRCIQCHTCSGTCPVGAIDPDKRTVNREACLACFGCINNCPEDAVVMEYLYRPVYGWPRFCRENGIQIKEPVELTAKT